MRTEAELKRYRERLVGMLIRTASIAVDRACLFGKSDPGAVVTGTLGMAKYLYVLEGVNYALEESEEG